MKLADMQVTAFVDLVASDAPAPGGGSVAALAGGIGAALTAMVSGLTIGKKKYAEVQDLVIDAQKKGADLQARFVDVMDRDTEAFNVVSAAFGMPKDNDEQKAARSAAIQNGLKGCTKTPFEMMELAAEAIDLLASIVGKSNDSAASDLGVAALSLKSAMQGAWLNVLINIGSIKDQDFVNEYRTKGEAMLARCLPIADECYNKVLASIQ